MDGCRQVRLPACLPDLEGLEGRHLPQRLQDAALQRAEEDEAEGRPATSITKHQGREGATPSGAVPEPAAGDRAAGSSLTSRVPRACPR